MTIDCVYVPHDWCSLPVGGAAHKEARIAEPWTLQLLLPKPKSKRRLRKPKVVMVDGHGGPRRMQPMECVAKSSFLRFPVSRSTSTSEIMYVFVVSLVMDVSSVHCCVTVAVLCHCCRLCM
jgi:hypothetical protein